jgi:N-formylglutamate amidohydrolase
VLEASFEIVEPPDGQESPVLVEAPHAGQWLESEAASYVTAPARCLARDADLYVDELFRDAPSCGATYLFARLSRYIVDLNRAPDDIDGAAVAGAPARDRPRGVIWRLTSDGLPVVREPLPRAEYERRIERFHEPYHRCLRETLERKREQFGFAVLLCAHSMPSPRPRGRGITPRLADIVPGTRGRTSADAPWIDLVERVARSRGWRVQHDVPYRGGYSTAHYGRPDDGIHAVQVEIARRLYMNEEHLGRLPEGFANVRSFACDLVRATVEEARRAAADGYGSNLRPTGE